MCTRLVAKNVHIKKKYINVKEWWTTVESLNSLEPIFRGLLKFYRFVGTYFREFSYAYKQKYDLFTFLYEFVEDANSWMRGTSEF